MALITMAVAKAHLRISTATTSPLSAQDQDIERKMESASDIILSYLKGRPIEVTSITFSGGVATVTTRNVHGFAVADGFTVLGAIEPEFNGAFAVATVPTTSTFTYPVTGTPAATATGIIRLLAAATWDEATVPARIQAAVLLMLARLYEQRGDDEEADEMCWNAIERLLMRDRDPALA